MMTNKYVLKHQVKIGAHHPFKQNRVYWFSSDLDPEDLSKGLFLSGFVNT